MKQTKQTKQTKHSYPLTDIERYELWKEIIKAGKLVLKLKGHDVAFKCVDGRGYNWTPEDVTTVEQIIKEAAK